MQFMIYVYLEAFFFSIIVRLLANLCIEIFIYKY